MITTPSAHTPRDIYIGDGTTVEFPVTFEVDRSQDIVVFLKLVDETEKRQIRNQDYVVREEEDDSYTVVMRDDDYRDPPAAGVMIVIQLDMDLVQPSGRSNMSAHVFRTRLDSLTRKFRQMREQLDRTLYVGQAYPDYALRGPVYETDPVPYILAVGNSTGIMRSRDGLTWEVPSVSGLSSNLNGLIFSPFHDRFMCFSNLGVYTSPDRSGAGAWVVNSALPANLQGVGVRWDNGTIIACTTAAKVYRSTNFGASWTQVLDTAIVAGGGSVVYVPWLDMWITSAHTLTKEFHTSTDDGLTWTARDQSTWISNEAMAFSPSRVFSADPTGGGSGRIAISSDGTSWSLPSITDTAGTRASACYGNGIMLQVGGGSATAHGHYSTDNGAHWLPTLLPPFTTYNGFQGCCFDQRLNGGDGLFLALINGGGPSNMQAIAYSPDCTPTSWQLATTPVFTSGWNSIATTSLPNDLI